MAERRRIIPASVGPLFKDQRDISTPPALRLELNLRETTEETCPEFAYPVLVKNAGGEESKENKTLNEVDEEDLAGLEAIARKFEEKYNAPSKKGKKKHMRLEDLIDAGMGYDESDPFVDNSECYDELVPSSLTTQFGGFYINTGLLKFRELSDSDDGDPQSKKPKTPKKKKRQKLENGEQRKMKRKLSSESGGTGDHISKKVKKHLQKKFRDEKKKKKKGPRVIRTPTVAELLKRNNGESPKLSQPRSATSSINGAPLPLAASTAPKAASSQPPLSTPQGAVTSSAGAQAGVDMSLDLGISMADLNNDKDLMGVMALTLAAMNGTEGIGGSAGAGAAAVGGDVDSDANVSPMAPGTTADEGGAKQMVSLPHGLPPQLDDNINKIKEAARKSVEGKTKFFNSYVNGLLLRIEHGTKVLSCSKRSAVYTHLADHLPCTKLTLQKRAKKLQLGAQDNQLKEPLQRLREAIAAVMPQQEQRHKKECEESAKKVALDPPLDAEGKPIEQKPPKKKFLWDDRLRKLLCDVVLVKVKTFEISKSRTQSAEEYLKAFLDAEVKILWPKEWMQTRTLFKESREVHEQVTSGKQRKVVSAGPRKLVMTKTCEEGEGSAVSPVPSAAKTQEGEPSSTQVNEVIGSPVAAKHLQDVSTLLDYIESGDDSMDAAISSSQPKPPDYGTASSDSNQEPLPSLGGSGGQNERREVPVSSSSPLPNLDPEFLVNQLISQQLVTGSQSALGVGSGAQSPGESLGGPSQSGLGRPGEMCSSGSGQVDLASKGGTGGVKQPVQSTAMTVGTPLSKQRSTDFVSTQASYAAKLSAISNAHTMRTLHNQEPGVQAKDVTSSSMVGGVKIRAAAGSAPKRDIPVSQPVIRLMRDTNIEKMKLQTMQPKRLANSSVAKAHNVGHSKMPYQSASNTPVQGRSSKANQRMSVGGAMDPTSLPQMSTHEVTPGNGNIRVSQSSQSTSHCIPYVSPTTQPRTPTLHSTVSAFSTPSPTSHGHHAQGQSPTARPQQTSPPGAHSYPSTPQQFSPHKQYSPGHTPPISAYPSAPSSYQAIGSFPQMSLGDMTARQSSGGSNFGNSYSMAAAQSSNQSGLAQSVGDAVITGPAPGTFFHATSTDPRYGSDGASSQHRIH